MKDQFCKVNTAMLLRFQWQIEIFFAEFCLGHGLSSTCQLAAKVNYTQTTESQTVR